MNKDTSLKTNDQKLVLLMIGNDDTGKKTLARQWMNKYTMESEENRTYYKIFNFLFDDCIDNEKISIFVEIRVMNGDEIETDLKVNSSFYKGAYGAFVVTNIEEFMSFQE
jgi:hypothetical protein